MCQMASAILVHELSRRRLPNPKLVRIRRRAELLGKLHSHDWNLV